MSWCVTPVGGELGERSEQRCPLAGWCSSFPPGKDASLGSRCANGISGRVVEPVCLMSAGTWRHNCCDVSHKLYHHPDVLMFSSKCCTPLMKATKNVTWRLLFDVTCLNARPSDSRVFILGVVVLDVRGSKVLYCCLYSSRPLTCVFVYVQILALFHLSMYNVIIVSTFNTTSAIKHCTVCVSTCETPYVLVV